MAKMDVNDDDICTDYRGSPCDICIDRNSRKGCRSLPSYQGRIQRWEHKINDVATQVVGIRRAIDALKTIEKGIFSKLNNPDSIHVNRMVGVMMAATGVDTALLYNGVNFSCFNCAHRDKTFSQEPCSSCMGKREPIDGLVHGSAPNFEPSNTDQRSTIREIAEKYRTEAVNLELNAESGGVSVYEILAYLLENLNNAEPER